MQKEKSGIIGFVLLGMLVFPVLLACGPSQHADGSFNKAVMLHDKGDYEEAIQLLRIYVYHHPRSYEANLLLGNSFLRSASGEERRLYLARYYLSRAQDLAENGMQFQYASRTYEKARRLTGIKGQ